LFGEPFDDGFVFEEIQKVFDFITSRFPSSVFIKYCLLQVRLSEIEIKHQIVFLYFDHDVLFPPF